MLNMMPKYYLRPRNNLLLTNCITRYGLDFDSAVKNNFKLGERDGKPESPHISKAMTICLLNKVLGVQKLNININE